MQHLLKDTLDSLSERLKYTAATRDLLQAKVEFENGYAKTTSVRGNRNTTCSTYEQNGYIDPSRGVLL
jgi:hypothetical protein